MKTVLCAAVLVSALFGESAYAASCGPHDAVVKALEKGGGVQSDIALQNDGYVVEIFRNVKTDRYAIILSSMDGKVACIISAGGNWKRKIVNKRGQL